MLARRVVLFTNLTAMLSGFALYMTWVILLTFYQLSDRRRVPEPRRVRLRDQRDRGRPLDPALSRSSPLAPSGLLRQPPRLARC